MGRRSARLDDTYADLEETVAPLACLALSQATHYLPDAWIWKVKPGNETAAGALGLPPAASGLVRPER